jgi:methylenetetrahydrofolate--tRNA-(uracil-5-)-methyltransferase
MHSTVTIIGGGLAGSEAALQLCARGIGVELWEQRLMPPPVGEQAEAGRWTEAHTSNQLAELVCSNSLKSTDPQRAAGLLKEELRQLDCRLLAIADRVSIPGGAALTVDREAFAQAVTDEIKSQPLITLRAEPFAALDKLAAGGSPAIIATGPLTSGQLWRQLSALVGSGGSYFYDATAPIVDARSVDLAQVFAQSRYDKGGGDDYLNCAFDAEQYAAFREALLAADIYPLHGGDDYRLFEGCLPVEELAVRGEDALRFGPLKPKGLTDPRTGGMPYAVAQLRWENALRDALGLVGFQTRLRFGEQERVLRLIPGLNNARFLRFGRMHRNSYLDAPRVLLSTLQLNAAPQLLVAGQLTGLEGYMSAIATGLWAGVNVARLIQGAAPVASPEGSCLGAMLRYMVNPAHKDYSPTAFQFGMLDWLPQRVKRQERDRLIRRRAEAAWAEMRGLLPAPA